MNRLPNEMVIDISSQLSFKDKLNLACSSKQLHKTVSENTLYNKLVFGDRIKLNQAVALQQKNGFSKQVHHLSIKNMEYDS